METNDIIAVQDEGMGITAGAIVWWRLHGGMDLEVLRTTWEAAGLNVRWLPEPPTPASALRRAVGELRDAGRIVHSAKNGGWVVTDIVADSDERVIAPTYVVAMTCCIDKVGRLAFQDMNEPALEVSVRESFERHLEQLIQADVSPWLCRVMNRVEAVALRDTGGVYFVPAYAMPMWERVKGALRASTQHVISSVPAMRTSEAAAAILDAVAQEAETTMTRMRDEMPNLKERGLQNRIDTTLDTKRKLEAYERLFGARLDNVREKLDGLRAELSVALVKSQETDLLENA